MSKPKAYDPQKDCMYQLFFRSTDTREWEHLDYATSSKDKRFLLGEYRLVYRGGYELKAVRLPKKYWPTTQT